jgi:hypothetical protein
MTASYQQLALEQVQPGMVLSDELLDVQGNLLLPQGTMLTESMLALMPRHGIHTLPIVLAAATPEQLAAEALRHGERINELFRKNDPDSGDDWATATLRRFVTDYRLGRAPGEQA